MKVQAEKLPGSIARLEIEVDQSQLEREMERAYKRLSNRVVIPGFRRGKAPRVLVERTLGEDAIFQEATKELVPDAISEALAQEKLEPVGEPESFNILDTEPLRFEVTVPLTPTVTLGDYRSVKVDRETPTVTESDVDEVIERLREREATWVSPEPPRPVQNGDQLVIDIQDFVDGEPIGEKQEDLTVELGNGQVIPELESQLVGVEEGKEYEFDATLPEDFPIEEYGGKSARFKVNVKSIKEKHIPEVDDEFVSRIGDSPKTVEELRATIRENLESRAAENERDRFVDEVIGQMVSSSSVDLPDVLVEREVDHQIEHLGETLRQQNLSMDQYLQYTGRSQEDMRAEMRDPARERLIRGLVLSEVAKAEDVQVEDAEVQEEVERMLSRVAPEEHAQAREVLESQGWQSRLRSERYDRKVLDRIAQIASGSPLYPERTEEPEATVDGEVEEAVEELEAERAEQYPAQVEVGEELREPQESSQPRQEV